MFTADDIQAKLREQPFVPLRIVSTSGQTYEIRHPELVLVGRRYLIIGSPSNENPTQFEVANRVAMLHVTDIQEIPLPSEGNGDVE